MKTFRITIDDVNVYLYETVQAKTERAAVNKVLKPLWDTLSEMPKIIVEQVSF